MGPPVALPDSVLVAHGTPTRPIGAPIEHPASLEDPTEVEHVDEVQPEVVEVQPEAGGVQPEGLVCMICGEGNLSGPNPECGGQNPMDCSKQYPPGVQTFCFSRDTKLSNGKLFAGSGEARVGGGTLS